MVTDFDAIVREHGPRLYNLAARMTGDREVAQDIVQEALLLVHRKLPGFRGESSLSTWMWRITANLCLREGRRLDRERVRRADADFESLLAQGRLAGHPQLEAWKQDPALALHYAELVARVQRECHFFILGLLTPAERIVFLLRSHAGLGFEEVGAVLGIGTGAAKARMARARGKLERDLRGRCSRHSRKARCTCESCAAYLVHRHPGVLEEVRAESTFAGEIAEAFRAAGDLADLYHRFPGLEWRIPPRIRVLVATR